MSSDKVHIAANWVTTLHVEWQKKNENYDLTTQLYPKETPIFPAKAI